MDDLNGFTSAFPCTGKRCTRRSSAFPFRVDDVMKEGKIAGENIAKCQTLSDYTLHIADRKRA